MSATTDAVLHAVGSRSEAVRLAPLVAALRTAGVSQTIARLVGPEDLGESVLDEELLNGHETIGLTAGASTPEELVRATAARLAEVGYALPEEIEVAKEDVHFRLPKEVAQA
jgi:4-hydroxy-3-methylbut-2-enyl diphosphate reductase IspH